MALTYKQLRELSDKELIDRYDKLSEHTAVGTGFYLEEIRRRDSERTNRTMKIVAYCSLSVSIISLIISLFK